MNAIYSYLFNVEISDQPILAKNSKKGLTYGELRILSFLRNPLFNIEEFQKREILLDNGQNEHTVDYSIMRVKSAIEIRIKCNDRTSLDARQFEILNEYIGKM